MATNFPTSLDALTNPSSTDSMATVSHSGQHANANDAIEALQAKVGVDSSAVTTSLDYRVGQLELGGGGGGASVTVSDTAPSSPTEGDLWFESDTGDIFVYYDSAWIDVGGSSVANISVSATAPTTGIVNGDLWFDTDTAKTYVYYDDGTSTQWVEVGAASAAASGVDGAVQFASGGTFASDASNLYWDDTNNRLGIGTTSPNVPLTVEHSNTYGMSLASTGTYSFLNLSDATSTGYNYVGIGALGDELRISAGGSQRMTIDSSGNVGVNTTNPTGRIHLYSNTAGDGQDANYLKIDRANTSTESAVNWATAGTNKWFLGTDNIGNDDILLYDWAGAKTALYGDSGTGILTFPNQPAFYAWRNSTTATSTAGVTIGFPTTTMNRGNHFSTSTSLFTAPVSGVYYFSLRVLSGNDSTDNDIRFKVNGTVLNTYSGYGSTYNGHKQSILSGTVYLNANDTIGGAMFGAGDTYYGSATYGHTSFSGYLVG